MAEPVAESARIIGLTGLYCAGKNFVARIFLQRRIPVLDVDKLGYQAIDARTEALAGRFGGIVERGKIDRGLLGRRVFGNPGELAALEAIIHPAVNELTAEWLDSQRGLCVINAALLHRSPALSRLCALVIVRAPPPVRFWRGLWRDKLPPGDLLRRFASQKNFPNPRTYAQYLAPKTDIYTISNPAFGSVKTLSKRVDTIVKGL
ncbi:MAG: dephospho-CoA kinase [Treponema sp.]|jgi:dephospho-CoA kinase|nr:dephospho-CoA kinase [Treponema sp.]